MPQNSVIQFPATHPAFYYQEEESASAQEERETRAKVAAVLRQMHDEEKARKIENCRFTTLCNQRFFCPTCQQYMKRRTGTKLYDLENRISQLYPDHVMRFSTVALDEDSAPDQIRDTCRKLHKALGRIYRPKGTSNPFYAAFGRIEFDPSTVDRECLHIHLHTLSWEPSERSIDENDLQPFIEEQLIRTGLTPGSIHSSYVRPGDSIKCRRYISKPVELADLADVDLLIPYITETHGLRLSNTIKSAEFKTALKTPASAQCAEKRLILAHAA